VSAAKDPCILLAAAASSILDLHHQVSEASLPATQVIPQIAEKAG
jgi:hypothetical protein